jgi:hypothetical protein
LEAGELIWIGGGIGIEGVAVHFCVESEKAEFGEREESVFGLLSELVRITFFSILKPRHERSFLLPIAYRNVESCLYVYIY